MTERPRSFAELFPGRFLKAANLAGEKLTFTIKDVKREELEGDKGKETKPIVTFQETPLELVCAKTNGLTLKELFGDRVADWIGKKVTLHEETWNGEPCIRVWGSPHLDKDKTIEIKLPRRAAVRRTLHAVKPEPPKTAGQVIDELAAAKRAEVKPVSQAASDFVDGVSPEIAKPEAITEVLDLIRASKIPTTQVWPYAVSKGWSKPNADGSANWNSLSVEAVNKLCPILKDENRTRSLSAWLDNNFPTKESK